jgi:hypothetical protein
MHMDVNQPRRNHETGDVDDSIRRFGLEYPDRRNNAAVNANVGYAVKGTGRVDDAPPTEKKWSAHRHLHTEKNRLAVQ